MSFLDSLNNSVNSAINKIQSLPGAQQSEDMANSIAQANTAKAASAPGLGSLISDIFLRSVVIILGFIFVAVGLTMLKSPPESAAPTETPDKLLNRAIKLEKKLGKS